MRAEELSIDQHFRTEQLNRSPNVYRRVRFNGEFFAGIFSKADRLVCALENDGNVVFFRWDDEVIPLYTVRNLPPNVLTP